MSLFSKNLNTKADGGYPPRITEPGTYTAKFTGLEVRPWVKQGSELGEILILTFSVEGSNGVITSWLYNSNSKPEGSVANIVSHTKQLLSATGVEAPEGDQDLLWAGETLEKLLADTPMVRIVQSYREGSAQPEHTFLTK